MQTEATSLAAQAPSRRGLRILWVSAFVNLLLLGAIGNQRWHRIGPTDTVVLSQPVPDAATQSPRSSRSRKAAVVDNVRNQIWNGIRSTNFLIYAEHLRQVGCPEKTVCAIVRPALNRWYEGQRSAHEHSQLAAGSNYWATGKRRRELRNETATFRDSLRKSLAGVQQSLGCPITEAFQQESAEDFLVFGFLGQDRLAEIEGLLVKASQTISEASDKGWGPMQIPNHASRTPSDFIRLWKQAIAFDRDLAGLLSPGDLEELVARYYCFERGYLAQTNSIFDSTGITPTEFRSLMLLCARAEHFSMAELNPYWPILEESPSDQGKSPSNKEVAALLGAQRAADFARETDPLFAGAKSSLLSLKVPESAAGQGYELVQRAVAMAADWRAQASQDPIAAKRAVIELRNTLRQQLGNLFVGISEDSRNQILNTWVDQRLLEAWNNTGGAP